MYAHLNYPHSIPICGSFPFTIDRNSRSVLSWNFDVLIRMIVSPTHDTTLATGHICPPTWGGRLLCINLRPDVKKKQCGNKPDRLLGATASVSICSLQNIYHNQTMMLPVQPGATLAHMLFIPPRPGSCLLCLLVHPGSKSGTVLVREPQVKTVCNHTKSIYEYYSCSAVSTIATLGYSL